jgi:hypothetical protein
MAALPASVHANIWNGWRGGFGPAPERWWHDDRR